MNRYPTPKTTHYVDVTMDDGYEPGTAQRLLQASTTDAVKFEYTRAGGWQSAWVETLYVAGGSYGPCHDLDGLHGDALIEALRDRPMVEVLLTADGSHGNPQAWHTDGPTGDDDWVAYERWTAEGRVGHGFLHRQSRRLIQAG